MRQLTFFQSTCRAAVKVEPGSVPLMRQDFSAKGRQLAGAFSTLCAFTRKRRDVESFHFCRFLKRVSFDERLELGGSFMFRNTSSSHASFLRRWAAAVSTSLPTRLTTCLPARVQLWEVSHVVIHDRGNPARAVVGLNEVAHRPDQTSP